MVALTAKALEELTDKVHQCYSNWLTVRDDCILPFADKIAKNKTLKYKISNRKKSRMDKIPNWQNPDWIKTKLDKFVIIPTLQLE